MEVQKPFQPILDEANLITRCVPSLCAKPGLEHRERAVLPKPSLRRDNNNRRGVQESKRPAIDPAPPTRVADRNGKETAHDEYNHCKVGDENSVGKACV